MHSQICHDSGSCGSIRIVLSEVQTHGKGWKFNYSPPFASVRWTRFLRRSHGTKARVTDVSFSGPRLRVGTVHGVHIDTRLVFESSGVKGVDIF